MHLEIFFYPEITQQTGHRPAKINLNNEKVQRLTMEAETEINRRDEVESLNRSIEIIKQDKALLDTHFAKSSDIVPFLNTIEALAPSVGASAQTASVDIAKDNSGLVVKVDVSGDFKSIYKFLTLYISNPFWQVSIIPTAKNRSGNA